MSCLNCAKRAIGCHSTCFEYILETKMRESEKERMRQVRKTEAVWHIGKRMRMNAAKYRPILPENPLY